MRSLRVSLAIGLLFVSTQASGFWAQARTPLLERYVSTPMPEDQSNQREMDAYASVKCQIFEDSVVIEHKSGGLWTSRTIPQRFDVKQIRTLLTEARTKQMDSSEALEESLVVIYTGYIQESGRTAESVNLLYNRSSKAKLLMKFIDMNCGTLPPLY